MVPPTVLVLDADLGFLLALAQELSNRQIVTIPARTSRQAHSFLARFRLNPDLLVVNCRTPGACALAEEITGHRRDVHIVAFVSSQNDCKGCMDRLAVRLHDPEDKEPDRISYCVDVIQRLMKHQARLLTRIC